MDLVPASLGSVADGSQSNLCTQPSDASGTLIDPKSMDNHSTRHYILNRQKAIEAKLHNCQDTHIKWVMKAGKNIVINLSTAAFELFRHSLSQLLKEKAANLSLYITSKFNSDQSGAIVDSTHKAYNLRSDGTLGKIHKFTVNLYRTQSSVLVNGTKVDMFVDHFLLPLEAQIKDSIDLLNNKHQDIKASLKSISACSARPLGRDSRVADSKVQGIPTPSQTDLPQDMTQPQLTQNVSRTHQNLDTSLFLCPHCKQLVDEGIQCDYCTSWMHSECEGVDDDLFDLYRSADTAYTCLSCRQMEECLAEGESFDSLNRSLLDEDAIRSSEVEEPVVDPPILDEDAIRPSEVEEPVVDLPILAKQPQPTTGREVQSKDSSPTGEPIPVILSPKQITQRPIMDLVQNSDLSGSEQNEVTYLKSALKSDNDQTRIISVPTEVKRKKPAPQRKQKSSDLEEQLNHAKSVIYSLEKEIQDKENSNKILSHEISLLKRLDPTTQNVTTQSAPVQDSQHGPPLPQNINVGLPPPSILHPPPLYPRMEQPHSFVHFQYEKDLQVTKDRLMALEIEQLKTKVSLLESMTLQKQMSMNHHFNPYMVNNPFPYSRGPGYIPNPMHNYMPMQTANPFSPFGYPQVNPYIPIGHSMNLYNQFPQYFKHHYLFQPLVRTPPQNLVNPPQWRTHTQVPVTNIQPHVTNVQPQAPIIPNLRQASAFTVEHSIDPQVLHSRQDSTSLQVEQNPQNTGNLHINVPLFTSPLVEVPQSPALDQEFPKDNPQDVIDLTSEPCKQLTTEDTTVLRLKSGSHTGDPSSILNKHSTHTHESFCSSSTDSTDSQPMPSISDPSNVLLQFEQIQEQCQEERSHSGSEPFLVKGRASEATPIMSQKRSPLRHSM